MVSILLLLTFSLFPANTSTGSPSPAYSYQDDGKVFALTLDAEHLQRIRLEGSLSSVVPKQFRGKISAVRVKLKGIANAASSESFQPENFKVIGRIAIISLSESDLASSGNLEVATAGLEFGRVILKYTGMSEQTARTAAEAVSALNPKEQTKSENVGESAERKRPKVDSDNGFSGNWELKLESGQILFASKLDESIWQKQTGDLLNADRKLLAIVNQNDRGVVLLFSNGDRLSGVTPPQTVELTTADGKIVVEFATISFAKLGKSTSLRQRDSRFGPIWEIADD